MRLSARTHSHLVSGLSDHRAATELYEFIHELADKVEKLEASAAPAPTPAPTPVATPTPAPAPEPATVAPVEPAAPAPPAAS